MSTSTFDWQRMIASSKGPTSPTTRHVLLTLGVFMDGDGGSCFPSTMTLSEATGLSERCVCEHLGKAAETGWIEITEKAGSGQSWKRHSYEALIPEKALTEDQHVEKKGTDRVSAPSAKGTDSHAEGTDPDDKKALTEGQSTNTDTISNTNNDARTFLLKDGSAFHIDDVFFQVLKDSYPNIDLDSEFKKISAWNISNPSKRKTRKGAKRFVNYWISNAKPIPCNQQTTKAKEFDFERQFHHDDS